MSWRKGTEAVTASFTRDELVYLTTEEYDDNGNLAHYWIWNGPQNSLSQKLYIGMSAPEAIATLGKPVETWTSLPFLTWRFKSSSESDDKLSVAFKNGKACRLNLAWNSGDVLQCLEFGEPH